MVWKPLTHTDRSLWLLLTNGSTAETFTICSSLTCSSTHGYKIPTHFPFIMHTHSKTTAGSFKCTPLLSSRLQSDKLAACWLLANVPPDSGGFMPFSPPAGQKVLETVSGHLDTRTAPAQPILHISLKYIHTDKYDIQTLAPVWTYTWNHSAQVHTHSYCMTPMSEALTAFP